MPLFLTPWGSCKSQSVNREVMQAIQVLIQESGLQKQSADDSCCLNTQTLTGLLTGFNFSKISSLKSYFTNSVDLKLQLTMFLILFPMGWDVSKWFKGQWCNRVATCSAWPLYKPGGGETALEKSEDAVKLSSEPVNFFTEEMSTEKFMKSKYFLNVTTHIVAKS